MGGSIAVEAPLSRNTWHAKAPSPGCPLWVISRHNGPSASCLLYPRKQTFVSASGMSEKCQKRTSVRYFGAVKERHPPRENGLPRWHIVGNGQCDPLAYQA